jgi:transcriptional regulator with XRE-family HTH domain
MDWGEFVRGKRLAAGYGLRQFASLVGILPSNYNHMEKGRMAPPQDKAKLDQIAEVLDMEAGSGEYAELMDLAVKGKDKLPADVEEFARRNELVPVLLRTLSNTKLTKGQLRDLMQQLNRDLSRARKAGRSGGKA